jgi:CheY-like chemotaxis protein
VTSAAAGSSKPGYEDRLQRFQKLMPRRVRRLLLVASRYDAFLLAEDGQLDDLALHELFDPSLRDRSWLTRIADGHDALAALQRRPRYFDLVVATMHIRNMDVLEFARRVKAIRPRLPVVVLAFDARELAVIRAREDLGAIERLYVWQGDFRILLAIVKSLEDRWNVAADTERVGVSSIILIEDSVRYYSSFLPVIYSELLKQSQRVIAAGMNLTNKVMRMRARPKILHCTSYEEALHSFEHYRRTLLGIISDVDFPRGNRPHAASGLDFARMVRAAEPELPIVLQTRDAAYAEKARAAGILILLKDSPFLLEELSRFLRESLGFGDFVFRLPDSTEVGRARDLRELEARLQTIPEASLLYHAEHNHYSTWLRARTEFSLAEALRPRRVSDFSSPGAVRRYLVGAVQEFRRERQSGIVATFDSESFQKQTSLAKVGGGSLGGKARGLAFVRQLLYENRLRSHFDDVRVFVPSALVLASDVFEQFLTDNNLRDFAIREQDDATIERRFLEARFPESVFDSLLRYLELVDYPLAVRSSSLLEDSQHTSFTGIYKTYMVPNSHPEQRIRVKELVNAIKRVYASVFSRRAKDYVQPTPYRLEQEKMSVIAQRLVGTQHGPRFYPDFSGVMRSHNFYPSPPMTAADGIVSVALGLGETVVAGGKCVRFAPRFPRHPIQFSTPDEILRNAQSEFYALTIEEPGSQPDPTAELRLTSFPLETAIADRTFAPVGSTYSPENDAVYDGTGRPGVPLVTFAPILKQNLFPLAEIASHLLELTSIALNAPVEIEFAANVSVPPGAPREFAVLQVRPFAIGPDVEAADLGRYPDEDLLCKSRRVLGNGRIDGIHDLVVVDRDRFDRARSLEVAGQVAKLNQKLAHDGVPYLLVGVGRWGAADSWLGIPVTWEQIAGARAIVESTFKDFDVAPSQGSHFFQNLAASLTGYFTVGANRAEEFVDWQWLAAQPALVETPFVRHMRLREPVIVLMDGRGGEGAIVKQAVAGAGGGIEDS